MPADIPASTWSQTDGSNTTAAPDGAPEGMAPSGVNDVIRMIMGAVKRWFAWTIPATTGGTTTAYTLSYSVAPAALVDGMTHLVQFNATNGTAPTLNINSLGAKPIHKYSGGVWGAVASGDITANMVCRVSYNSGDGTYRIISSALTGIGAAFLAVAQSFTALQTFTAGIVLSGSAINEASATVASASTTNIGAAAGNYLIITGTTTITAFDTVQAGTKRKLKFSGILTLTHDATALICLGGASITTAAGDVAEFVSEGSGNWRMTSFERASGSPLAFPASGVLTNSISGDVNLNNTGTYFDGPSVAQGTTGTWFASGTITVRDPSNGNNKIIAKLWDGTTVIASAVHNTPASVNEPITIALSGKLASPAGNIKISVNAATYTTAVLLASYSGLSKDSTLTAYRIA